MRRVAAAVALALVTVTARAATTPAPASAKDACILAKAWSTRSRRTHRSRSHRALHISAEQSERARADCVWAGVAAAVRADPRFAG